MLRIPILRVVILPLLQHHLFDVFFFQDLTILCENFSLPPTTLTTTARPTSTLCDVSALALGLNFEDPGS